MFIEAQQAAAGGTAPAKHAAVSHPKYRPDIDGLRAIAVLSVVGFHAFPTWVRGGFTGVDVFFVISGFLISTILFENLRADTFSFADFYARRVKRIFPALALVLAACYAFGWFALLPDEYKQLGRHVAGGAGFVSNLVLWSEAGYFDSSAENKPLLHLWSLGIEEQFYIVWPLLLWLAWKRRFNLLVVTLVVVAVSFWFNLKGVKPDPVGTFYAPHTRFWELLGGGLLAWAMVFHQAGVERARLALDRRLGAALSRDPAQADGRIVANVLSVLGLLLLAYGFTRLHKGLAFPGTWALVPVLGAVLVILAGPAAWINRKLLSHKVVVWFGLISFPLYLWHWPLLSFARVIESGTPSATMRGALVLASIVLAWGTYRLLETRMRAPGGTRAKVGVLVVLMAALGGLGWATYVQDGIKSRGHIQATNAVNAQLVGWNWPYSHNERCLKKYPMQGWEGFGYWFCMANSDADPTLLILGNSHANHLYPGLAAHPLLRQQSILDIGNCEAAWVERSALSQVLTPSSCTDYRSADQQDMINGIIDKSPSIRYVIMSGGDIAFRSDPAYIASLKKRIDFVEAHNAKVIVFTPHVYFTYNPRACFARPFAKPKENCELPIAEVEKRMKTFNTLARSITASNPSVRIFDESTAFCDAVKCSYVKDGLPLLRDEYGHLSEAGSAQVAATFVEWAKTNAPGLLKQ